MNGSSTKTPSFGRLLQRAVPAGTFRACAADVRCTVVDCLRGISTIGVALALLTAHVHAEAVDGPWTNAVGQGNGPITNANTNAPVVGNGSPNSAEAEMIDSPFTAITLTNPGDKIIFTGSVTLSGTIGGDASSGNPRTQFRFGLFDSDDDDLGWVGYLMTNAHGSGSPNGTLSRKNAGNTNVYLSTTAGATSLASTPGNGTLFHDGTYAMSMTIERNNSNHLLVTGTLIGSNGFNQTLSTTDTAAASLGTYTFDSLGFLLGGNLDADLATFANLNVQFVPAAETLTLEVLAAGPHAGAMRLVNRSDESIDFSYYEIRSAAGSLDSVGWRSLDDQSATPPPLGWGEAPGSSAHLLSEALILGSTTLTPGAALPLGQGYAGSTNDLELWVGDGVNPLRLGDVTFVMPGDFDGDGEVDGADLAQWQGGVSAAGGLGDADFDGDSDGADFLAWQRNVSYPTFSVAAAANVPEPHAALLASLAAGLLTGGLRTRKYT